MTNVVLRLIVYLDVFQNTVQKKKKTYGIYLRTQENLVEFDAQQLSGLS